MTDLEHYAPGPARGAQVRKGEVQTSEVQKKEDKWTLILVRELRHSPAKVWQALTDPAHLREWAPFEADGSLGKVGTTVKLTTVRAPRHASAPHKSALTGIYRYWNISAWNPRSPFSPSRTAAPC